MRIVLALLLFTLACGGPTHDQLIETQTARTPRRPVEAPPASSSDEDRDHLTQSFDDMETTQRAREEAKAKQAPAPQPAAAPQPPKKKGVAEQATLPKKK